MPDAVRNNTALSRFELDVEGATAFVNYRQNGNVMIFTHTETPRALRDRGIGSRVVKGALEYARAEKLKVVAGCGFVAEYLRAHPEFADVAG